MPLGGCNEGAGDQAKLGHEAHVTDEDANVKLHYRR
jgi:hypothetical protein